MIRPRLIANTVRHHVPPPTVDNAIYRSIYTTTTRSQLSKPRREPLTSRRTFLSATTPSPQTLAAKRTLSCPPSIIYNVISDVANYSAFVPFCQQSLVTKTSAPAPNGKTYPEEATLVVGLNDSFSEKFTSRVYCVPERIVEAVSGQMTTKLPAEDIAHHSPRREAEASGKSSLLQFLTTRWTLRPLGEASATSLQEKTEVTLAIEFQFANPLYAAMSRTAVPRMAEKTIEAFERRLEVAMRDKSYTKS